MKIQPDELSKHGYVLFDQFKHDDLLPFVQKYLRERNRSITGYYIANIALTLLLIILLFNKHALHWDKKFQYLGLGVLFALMLIPIHEILHAIAYKICGAKKVSFGANLKQFYFIAMADQFVANRGEFIFVALAHS